MNGTQTTILVAYGIAVILSVVVGLVLWISTSWHGPVDKHRLAEFEKRWLVIVAGFLVALLAATLWFKPYGKSTASDAQVGKVDARQFFWKVSPRIVSMRRPVAFETRSDDVNHGFGIYRGRTLVAQIQVVPDKTSTLI